MSRLIIALIAPLMCSALCAQADLSALVSERIKGAGIPAMATAVYHQGELVATGCAGIRKKGHPEEVTINDKFHLGSCTKSMTALLAAILVKEQKVHWETTLQQAFPKMEIHPLYQKVTLHQLLTHTAGTPKALTPEHIWQLRKSRLPSYRQRQELATTILGKKPETVPGTDFVYSNTGYAIAGAMLEAAAGKPYETLLQERIFKPLSLTSAGFRAPAASGPQPFGHKKQRGKVFPVPPEPYGDAPPSLAAASSVHMSVLDFVKYAQHYLQEDPQLITQELKKDLFTPSEHKNYGLGWQLGKGAYGNYYTHSGSNESFTAFMIIIPEQDFAAVTFANLSGGSAVAVSKALLNELQEKFLK